MIIEIVRGWAEPVISALAQGRKPLAVGEWVTWTQVTAAWSGKLTAHHATRTTRWRYMYMYDLDSSNRLTCAQHSRLYSPTEAQSAIQRAQPDEERRRADGIKGL
jgi:hypothetical protein